MGLSRSNSKKQAGSMLSNSGNFHGEVIHKGLLVSESNLDAFLWWLNINRVSRGRIITKKCATIGAARGCILKA
jgi:hypothetical protein